MLHIVSKSGTVFKSVSEKWTQLLWNDVSKISISNGKWKVGRADHKAYELSNSQWVLNEDKTADKVMAISTGKVYTWTVNKDKSIKFKNMTTKAWTTITDHGIDVATSQDDSVVYFISDTHLSHNKGPTLKYYSTTLGGSKPFGKD